MEKSTTGDQKFHILEQMRQWVKIPVDPSHENEIIQFKKGNQREFTYSTENGRFRKFIARIINFFSKKDYFDEKKIGNSTRQKKVADLFLEQIKEARNDPNYTFEWPSIKLTRIYVESELRRAGLLQNNFPAQMVPQNDILGVFGNSVFDKDISASFDFETDFQTLAGINIDGLRKRQVNALRNVYLNWQLSIENAESIPEDNRRHILGNLIRNSTPLLQIIIDEPVLANDYLRLCRDMADKLSEFLTRNVQGNTTIEQTSQEAFDLMSEFTQFANRYGNILQLMEERPSLGDCILFPVLQVATKLGGDESFQGYLAGNHANVVNSLLQIADKFAVAKGKNVYYCKNHINTDNFADNSFDLAISFEPIRCFINLVGPPSNVMSQPHNVLVKPTSDENSFAIKANVFVNQYCSRKINLQWHATNHSFSEKINEDSYLQDSLKSCTGISWKYLTAQDKQNISETLDLLAYVAATARKDVESYLQEMKPILVKVMDNVSFLDQYKNTMAIVSESMKNICMGEAKSEDEFNDVITEYMNGIAKPLLELNKQLGVKINFGLLSMSAVIEASSKCYEENYGACIEFGSDVGMESSTIQHLAKTTQALQREHRGMRAGRGADKFAYSEVLNTEPLCQFALYMNNAAKYSDDFKGTVMTGNESWLKAGKMSENDFYNFVQDKNSVSVLTNYRENISNQTIKICRDDSVPAKLPYNKFIDQIPGTWEVACTNNLIFITGLHVRDILNYFGENPDTINHEQGEAVKQFAYLFIDENNTVSEEAIKENSQFLNALLKDPKLSNSLQKNIDLLADLICDLAVAGTYADFSKIMSEFAYSLNMIRIDCEDVTSESDISNEFRKLNFGMIISALATVIAKDQPIFYEILAKKIDASPSLQSVLAAIADLRIDAEQGQLSNNDLITNYASAPSFLPLFSMAYMNRDKNENGLGVKILNSTSKEEIREHLNSEQQYVKYENTKLALISSMKFIYDKIENKKARKIEYRQTIKAIVKEREDINELSTAVDWESFRPVLDDVLARSGSEGAQPPFDPMLMFKILVFKAKDNMSDAQIAHTVFTNRNYWPCLGISSKESLPDEKTIEKFQNDLVQAEVYQKLFMQLNKQLIALDLTAIKGQSADATIMETP